MTSVVVSWPERWRLAVPMTDLRSRSFWNGGVAQLGERLLCKQEVIGSIPFTSTTPKGGGGAESQADAAAEQFCRRRVI